ncbi:O-antigen polymerase [uncultured Shewanella sp.]|uniref:O-antigen polymerase n=1 Tax=uncultured Shewanella sp. TaxID=173975 RepID=UPI00260CB1F2|nr:O-antigen polymerase [uncultured Shewanella sp.]
MISFSYYSLCFIVILLLSYIFSKKRYFDIFSLLTLSSIFYFSPFLVGSINIYGFLYSGEISSETYLYINIYFILLTSYIIFFDFYLSKSKVVVIDSMNRELVKLFFSISTIIFLVGIYIAGIGNLLNSDKTNLATQNTAIYGLGIWFITCSLLLSYINKSAVMFVICSLLLTFSLYVGSRSNIVIAILTILLFSCRNKKFKLLEQYKKGFLLLFVVAFLAIFKLTYKYIKNFDFGIVVDIYKDVSLLDIVSLIIVDPNAVAYNFNMTIVNEVTLGTGYFFHRLFSIVPGMGEIFEQISGTEYIRYSAVLAKIHNIHFGLASSIHGEIIAISGIFGFITFLIIFFMFLTYINYRYLFRPSKLIILSLPFLVYNVFYAFRVDITFCLGTLKVFILVMSLVTFFSALQSKFKRSKFNETIS